MTLKLRATMRQLLWQRGTSPVAQSSDTIITTRDAGVRRSLESEAPWCTNPVRAAPSRARRHLQLRHHPGHAVLAHSVRQHLRSETLHQPQAGQGVLDFHPGAVNIEPITPTADALQLGGLHCVGAICLWNVECFAWDDFERDAPEFNAAKCVCAPDLHLHQATAAWRVTAIPIAYVRSGADAGKYLSVELPSGGVGDVVKELTPHDVNAQNRRAFVVGGKDVPSFIDGSDAVCSINAICNSGQVHTRNLTQSRARALQAR